MALYLRLGCLFRDFKAKPGACAMFMSIKLWQRASKGALLGVFYGTCLKFLVILHAASSQQLAASQQPAASQPLSLHCRTCYKAGRCCCSREQ